jgi:hypothetical protein
MATPILTIIILIFGLVHPFHISICEIEHDEASGTLQITSRLFQDDFESALHADHGDGFFKSTAQDETTKVLSNFFEQHLQVSIDSNPVKQEFLGFEVEDNVVWCYLEIQNVRSVKEITVKYSVLTDTFDDQINLAHIRYQGAVKSLRFSKSQLSGTAAFTN